MTATSSTYRAYGLRISSPIRLPGLERTDGNPDVSVEYGRIDSTEDAGSPTDEIRLSYDGVGRFAIRDGRRVVVDPVEDVADAALLPYLLGPVLGAVLYQRGYLVLHASSVSIRGAAVAFLGPSGAGKSTIAAACRARGHALLSDDITAIEIADGEPMVVPGVPLLKLAPELPLRLDLDWDRLSAVSQGKELYRVPGGVPRSRRPLDRLYVLAEGDLRSAAMSPGERIQALVGHTYTQSLLDEASIGDHFRQCARVAETAAVRRLSRPRDLDSLPATVRRIEEAVGR
jgi:hypothetical protein